MREIGFRAWDIEAKEMLGPFSFGCEFAGDGFDVDWILMQYTGLQDKNGREIYEGDILKEENGGIHDENGWRTTYSIGWIDWAGPFEGYHRYRDIDKKYGWVNPIWSDKTETIGNIHENPELLEESANQR